MGLFKTIFLKKLEEEGMNSMETQQKKLWEIFRQKYLDDFSKERDDAPNEIERPWCEYIFSIGCKRDRHYKGMTYPSDSVMINCPDAYHRAYDSYYIAIPLDFAFKVLALGFLP
jgi:hypothetical protein